MKAITQELIHVFKPHGIDWMGYTYENNKQLSFHHIKKKENGGLYEFDNGALLRGNTSHEYLHLIEVKDLDMYIYINHILKIINEQRYTPTKQQLIQIRDVLELFEKEHCADRTMKGKQLIKYKYLDRRVKL